MLRKKKTVLFLWIPVGIVLAALLILLAGYVLALCEKPDLKNSKLTAKHAPDVPLGSKAELQMEVTLPVDFPRPTCSVEAPAGTVAGPIQVRHGSYLWKHNRWIIQCPLYAVKPGAAVNGKIAVSIKGRFPADETFRIPDFVIVPVPKNKGQLDLAAALPEERTTPFTSSAVWAVTGGILILLAGLWLWLRWRHLQKNGPIATPPWVKAELALDRLAVDVAGKKVPLASAFFKLTDVVRKYLEERYHLPVTTRTTDEFMSDLRDSSPLPAADQPFLRDFLTSADLIKFAQMPPDEKSLRHALEGARELVRHTIPAGQDGKEGEHV